MCCRPAKAAGAAGNPVPQMIFFCFFSSKKKRRGTIFLLEEKKQKTKRLRITSVEKTFFAHPARDEKRTFTCEPSVLVLQTRESGGRSGESYSADDFLLLLFF